MSRFQLSSLLPLFCAPSAALPLGSPCQGLLPKYLWFIFACQKVSVCPRDRGEVLRIIAQCLLNSFWQEVLGAAGPQRAKLPIGWGFFLLLLLLLCQGYIAHEEVQASGECLGCRLRAGDVERIHLVCHEAMKDREPPENRVISASSRVQISLYQRTH